LNLPLWKEIGDCFVFAVDDRTDDDTVGAIKASIAPPIPYSIVSHSFDGFAGARNAALETARQQHAAISHVLIADSDW
jgi:hypothetical protein